MYDLAENSASGRAAAWAIRAAALLVALIFALIVGDVIARGIGPVDFAFLTAPVIDAGRAGGIGPILVSTVLILFICLAAAVPVGIASAVVLAEFTAAGGFRGRLIRRSLDILAGVPSIVFGLFGNAFFAVVLGFGFSILTGGLTLACMILPLLIRALESGFRAVSDEYRRAGAALGVRKLSLVGHVLLPAAMPGLVVGLVLGIGRAVAETAALIFTSGYVDRWPGSVLDSGRALSVHIYDLAMNVPGGTERAYASALVLLALLLLLTGAAAALADRWLGRKLRPA